MSIVALCLAFAVPSTAFFWDEPPSPPPRSGGTDMRSTFAKLTSCTACTGAGYGWCPLQRKCGGFANKECGIGPNYVAEGYLKPKAAKKPDPTPDFMSASPKYEYTAPPKKPQCYRPGTVA